MEESTAPARSPIAPRETRRASTELCCMVESLIAAAVVPATASLSDVRGVLSHGMFTRDGEILFPQDCTSLVIEVDELIDRDGAQTPAHSYTAGRV